MRLIVFSNVDETVITTPEDEDQTIQVWFTEGGRDLEEWDRQEYVGAVAIKVHSLEIDGDEAPAECQSCGEEQ